MGADPAGRRRRPAAGDDADSGGRRTRGRGWPQVRERLKSFTPERVTAQTGVAPETIRSLAREFADAPSSVAYSRVGVCNSRFGTLGTWATDVLNLAAGRLGAVGGAMFPTPPIAIAAVAPYLGLGDGHGRWRSRVRGLPEVFADLPTNTLADEIETPGGGQVRALFVYAGNPVVSVPNSRRLSRALEKLEFMVAVDVYVNETTRHADVILPPAAAVPARRGGSTARPAPRRPDRRSSR